MRKKLFAKNRIYYFGGIVAVTLVTYVFVTIFQRQSISRFERQLQSCSTKSEIESLLKRNKCKIEKIAVESQHSTILCGSNPYFAPLPVVQYSIIINSNNRIQEISYKRVFLFDEQYGILPLANANWLVVPTAPQLTFTMMRGEWPVKPIRSSKAIATQKGIFDLWKAVV